MPELELKERDDRLEGAQVVMVHGTAWDAVAHFFRWLFHRKEPSEDKLE